MNTIKTLYIAVLSCVTWCGFAQNNAWGINTETPQRSIDVNGNLKVTHLPQVTDVNAYNQLLVADTDGNIDKVSMSTQVPSTEGLTSLRAYSRIILKDNDQLPTTTEHIKVGRFVFAFDQGIPSLRLTTSPGSTSQSFTFGVRRYENIVDKFVYKINKIRQRYYASSANINYNGANPILVNQFSRPNPTNDWSQATTIISEGTEWSTEIYSQLEESNRYFFNNRQMTFASNNFTTYQKIIDNDVLFTETSHVVTPSAYSNIDTNVNINIGIVSRNIYDRYFDQRVGTRITGKDKGFVYRIHLVYPGEMVFYKVTFSRLQNSPTQDLWSIVVETYGDLPNL